jgi:hypothetical protein
MRRKLYTLTITVILNFSQAGYAQNFQSAEVNNSFGFSGTGANINVYYHRANWTIDPNGATKNISGTVTTYFKTTQANVSAINFDLNKASFNNGSLVVRYHGTVCAKSFPSSGLVNILNITLPVTIAATGTRDSVDITYSGIPPSVPVGSAAEGYQKGSNGGDNYVMTLSESYEDRDWWPCKADMQDKIDSAMDMNFTVPWNAATGDTFWVAANGKLVDSAMITGTTRNFSFKTTYPIASYLVALAVGKFTRYYKLVNVNGTNTQVAYYLLRNTTSHATKITAMDKINLVITAFSSKFGDYPFKLEKHGYYDGLMGAGGMEHQTFSGIATTQFNVQTLVHELTHQWFGDNVSFSTWNDLWLAEGFARYSEVLAGELVPSLGLNPYTMRSSLKANAMAINNAATWIPDASIANSDLIWNSSYGSTVYERGGMVVSMLRVICGDAVFFQALTNYQTNRAGKSATTDTLKNYFNALLGRDISSFFNDYVGGSGNGAATVGGIGNPVYSINWNTPVANKLALQVGSQTQSSGSNVAYFNGPVVIHATNAVSGWTKDTTIVFYDWGGGSLSYAGNGLSAPAGSTLVYNLSFTPVKLFIDDSARTLIDAAASTTNKITTLAIKVEDFTVRKTAAGNLAKLSITTTDPITKVELQKSSNGTDFAAAGEMNLSDPGNQTLHYGFTDIPSLVTTVFYRAKIYYAGKEEFTGIVKIQSANTKGIIVSPNPAYKDVRIAFDNAAGEELKIKIMDAGGKQVKEIITNSNFIHFDTTELSSGIYMIQVIQQGEVSQTRKFLVRH